MKILSSFIHFSYFRDKFNYFGINFHTIIFNKISFKLYILQTYIYIDESGNLGLKNKEDNFFIISAIKISDEQTHLKLLRIIKKIRQRKLKKKLKETSEIKFTNSSEEIRKLILTEILKLNVEIYSIIIDKNKINKIFRDNLMNLYNYLLKELLESIFTNINKNYKLKIVLDRCMNSFQRKTLQNYIESEFLILFRELSKVELLHENSINYSGLQLADFTSGAIAYKYNKKSLIYVNCIKEKIKLEKFIKLK